MHEAYTTLVGTVINDPVTRLMPSGDEVTNFRIASNARRPDREGEWTDNGTVFASVSCWRRLVKGVSGSIIKGDPVIVYGQLRTTTYTSREGVERNDLEIRAMAVGPDLARCSVKLDRRPRVNPAPEAADPEAPSTTSSGGRDDQQNELIEV